MHLVRMHVGGFNGFKGAGAYMQRNVCGFYLRSIQLHKNIRRKMQASGRSRYGAIVSCINGLVSLLVISRWGPLYVRWQWRSSGMFYDFSKAKFGGCPTQFYYVGVC